MLRVDVGTLAAQVAQAIADGVLRAQRRVARISKLVVGSTRRNGNRGACDDVVFPGYRTHAGVEAIGVRRVHAPDDE